METGKSGASEILELLKRGDGPGALDVAKQWCGELNRQMGNGAPVRKVENNG